MRSFLLLIFVFTSLLLKPQSLKVLTEADVVTGAQQFELYLPKLKGKKVAIVTNISGMVGNKTIVDTLLKLKVNIKKIFGPEHGFRGTSDAGEKVKSNIDKKTGIPVTSLYGSHKKPTAEDLKGIDVVVYDIQDVGVRFYTFISTLTYVMQACAEQNKELIVLDRPNPNGFYVDGPVMKDKYKSFLGVHNVPLVYGMTTGEYAQMVNGERWFTEKVFCKLTVVPVKNYDHNCTYVLPVKPSPNLPTLNSVLLYPSLGLFEGTIMSLGRGTDFPFEVLGHPLYSNKTFSFMPKTNAISKEPKYFNKICYGVDLRKENLIQNHPRKIELKWLINFYADLKDSTFMDKNFNWHSGDDELQQQIRNKIPEADIRLLWEKDIKAFKAIRKKYLLYKDFE
ncbi:MAG: DUF1343 domain-containing protein [Bacteroidia bacterium]|nr:DUF1343 domain-containing protein [Bacteroidia bacterium]